MGSNKERILRAMGKLIQDTVDNGRDDGTREATLASARANLGHLVRDASVGTPTILVKHGTRVAALISIEDLRRLRALDTALDFLAVQDALTEGHWSSIEQVEEEVARQRRSDDQESSDGRPT